MKQTLYIGLIVVFTTIGIVMMPQTTASIQAQPRITNTTISVVIPSTAPTEPPQAPSNNIVEASPSPTFTPTQPLPNARLVSIAPSGTALIRDFPEDGAVIGVLADNTDYQVIGQYFSWYQIQLPSSPANPAWVYFQDVQLSGNLNEIPAVDPNVQPAELSVQDIETATAAVLFQTPSFAETATANARVIEITQEGSVSTGPTSEFLPTYTPPADIVQLQATNIPNFQATPIPQTDIVTSLTDSVAQGNIPPILIIGGLLVFGTLGLLISAVRR